MKRRILLALVLLVGAAAGASFAILRTPWAGTKLCGFAAQAIERSTGQPLAVGSCRVDPARLELVARAVRFGPAEHPVLEAELVRVRLAALQAPGGHLNVAALEVRRPRVVLDLPEGRRDGPPAACPPPALARVDLRAAEVEDAKIELRLPSGARLAIARADLSLAPAAGKGWPVVGSGRSSVELRVRGATWDDAARHVALREAHVAAELARDLSRAVVHEAAIEGEDFVATARGAIDDLCKPRLHLRATAKAPIARLLALAGRPADGVAGSVEASVAVDGAAGSPAATGDVRLRGARLGQWIPGDATARVALSGRELKVEQLEVAGRAGSRVRGRAVVRLEATPRLEAEAELANVELAEVLERTGLPGAWVLLRVNGKARIAGTLSPLALAGEGALDLADFRVFSHSWETWRAPEQPILEIAQARLEAGVKVSRESVRIEDGRLRAGAESLRADAELFLASERGFSVRVEGGADLDVVRRVAGVPLGGRAQVRGTARAAPYGNPRIEAEVRARDFRFLDLDLGEVAARTTYGPKDHVLHVAEIDGRKGETRYQGETSVDLARSPPEVQGGRLAARGRLRDLFEAVMPWLPSARIVRDAVDAPAEVDATAHGPATALEADFTARLGAGRVLERPFDSAVLEGRVEAGARAVFRRAVAQRSGGSLRGSGRWEFAPPHAWDLSADWTSLPLGEALGSAEAFTGRADGTARLLGSLDQPDVRFSSTARDASVGGVPLRDARAEGRVEGDRLTVDARAEGFELAATARTHGDGPFDATIALDHDDVGRLFRAAGSQGARLRVRGSAKAQGVLADVPGAHADVTLDRLEAAYADFRVANDGPVRLALAGRRLEIRPFPLRGTNTALTVQGAVAPGGALAIDATGTLDLRIVGGSVPRISTPHGLLALEARVAGTLADPLLVGTGRLRDGGFQFKDVPIAFSGLAGDLAFSQSRVIFDRLDGAVNGGRAELAGEVELVKLFPERLRVRAAIDEVPLRIPEWLPTVVAGQVVVDGAWDSMDVGGKLHVLRARYTENLDLERSALEFRRRAAVGKAYDPAGEWLRFDVQLVVDGDARVENDVVRGAVRGEVTLTGTLGAPGLVGTLTMAEGSRATFRGNEFALTHAVVDYTERRGVKMHLDVTGETRVREYQVFMHLFGPYDAPVLHLTSQPALTQEDLVALLSLGFTTRDAALSGTAGGAATAAAAQALFSVSGLDEQVRRFLPRGGPLQEFTVRMTTAYSEGSGQVEPRAEFESKLLDDRLRLRWQAPLSAARGQRAQAELKVGGRASLQYQWENDNPDVATGGDHGVDLKLRWEWND